MAPQMSSSSIAACLVCMSAWQFLQVNFFFFVENLFFYLCPVIFATDYVIFIYTIVALENTLSILLSFW